MVNHQITILAIFLTSCSLLMSCSDTQNVNKGIINERISDTNSQDAILEIEVSKPKLPPNDIGKNKHLIKGKQIFKISNELFFKSDSILSLFKNKEQHRLGFFVPLAFSLVENDIFIPNRAESSIMNYSKNGEFVRELKLSNKWQPDYFILFTGGNFVLNDFLSDTLVQFVQGEAIYKTKNSDLMFSSFGDNFLFRKRTHFFDKKGYFNGEYKFTYLYSTFDYMLIDEASFGLIFYDEEKGRGVLRIIKQEGFLFKNHFLNIPLNWEDYYGVKILQITNKNCLFLLTGGINDLHGTKLIKYDFDSEQAKIVSLTIDYNGNSFIGEGADLWSNGVLYKYNQKENAVYSLFTGDEFIHVHKYSLE